MGEFLSTTDRNTPRRDHSETTRRAFTRCCSSGTNDSPGSLAHERCRRACRWMQPRRTGDNHFPTKRPVPVCYIGKCRARSDAWQHGARFYRCAFESGMSDQEVRELAQRAGIELKWTDYAGRPRDVPLDAVRAILSALRLPCRTTSDIADSRRILAGETSPRLITASMGQAIDLPPNLDTGSLSARLTLQEGMTADCEIVRTKRGIRIAPIDVAGYHQLEIGGASTTLAVAPTRCFSIDEVAPGKRLAGLAAQVYGLRHDRDCGIGDMAGVTILGTAAAAAGIDALALSPTHALFTA